MDLYQSYLDVLRQLWPRVRVGGVVAFDEYFDVAAFPGAKAAIDEFFAGLPPGRVRFHTYGDLDNLKRYAIKLPPAHQT